MKSFRITDIRDGEMAVELDGQTGVVPIEGDPSDGKIFVDASTKAFERDHTFRTTRSSSD